ncbi:MAG: hypothetical protein KA304_08080, partial [Aeromonas sp.]|nr:hypothetical protein [Aeromonas sp.]
MSKSCCSHQHTAATGKAVTSQVEHQHDSHCCDNVEQVSCCASKAPHDHQDQGVSESPGDEEPP